jgi:hypothetical protein
MSKCLSEAHPISRLIQSVSTLVRSLTEAGSLVPAQELT